MSGTWERTETSEATKPSVQLIPADGKKESTLCGIVGKVSAGAKK